MLCKPVSGPITSRYGWRIINGVQNFHNGIDYGWLNADIAGSRKVYSAAPGLVVDAGYSLEPGNYVLVDLGNGYKVRYIHLASYLVTVGQRVGYSTPIGTMGDIGTATSRGQIHLHMDLYKGSTRVNPEPHVTLPFGYTGNSLAGGDVEPIPIPPAPNFGEDMIVYANLDTNAWAAGIPFGGVWTSVPSGQGDAYVKASGRDLVRLSGAEFTIVAGICKQRGSADVRVYADTTSNVWYLVGPGVDYAIPGARAALFESLFGSRVPLSSADLAAVREAFAQTASSGGAAPTAAENAAAVEAALADNFARVPTDVNNDLKNRL